jgi:hypothetical protein
MAALPRWREDLGISILFQNLVFHRFKVRPVEIMSLLSEIWEPSEEQYRANLKSMEYTVRFLNSMLIPRSSLHLGRAAIR